MIVLDAVGCPSFTMGYGVQLCTLIMNLDNRFHMRDRCGPATLWKLSIANMYGLCLMRNLSLFSPPAK
jgi:hypothetical protein